MKDFDEDIRVEVYRSFAETGAPPDLSALAEVAEVSREEARDALRRLADAHHLVLDSADRIVMAHPFASVPLGFSVMGERTLWWGGCAWDSFAIPHLAPGEPEVLVSTRCPGCGAAHAWVVNREGPPAGEQVAHFLTPMAHVWDDILHACGNQRLFCGRPCVDAWLSNTGNLPGYVMDLTTLWNFAGGWYAGRLGHGYIRREPETAAAYFREVGLRGPFWGLP
ncbi:MAG: organomercurial lyase [Stackebrandtia sp.]